ncbi:exported hypothetical protein [Mesorhizobium plurifarium]|uniref:Uncharacterized protein n=1 Tax=Mesorhizobium plurifarium TaxID=69974 RepID=A0A090FYY9_MESPL|nr:exported hypothetical protein [Mesorhizobium plurifarium]
MNVTKTNTEWSKTMESVIATAFLMVSTLAFAFDVNENDMLSIDARRDTKTYPCGREKTLPSVKWESGCVFVDDLPHVQSGLPVVIYI